jgi:hypothetical protein
MAYLAVRISVQKPSGKIGGSDTREALGIVMDQVKILLDNLQMVDASVIFLPYKAKYRAGENSDMIVLEENVQDNYDFMRKYFPRWYVHRYHTYMYSNVLMAFNMTMEDLLRENSNILYKEHQAMYPRELQVEECIIVGSFLYSHRDMQGRRLMDFLSIICGYHITA